MKKITKRILIISAATAGTGLLTMGIGLGLGGRPGVVFGKDGIQSPYQKKNPYYQEKTALDKFSNLNLKIGSSADVRILPSNDEKYYVEYLLDGEYSEPACKVENDTLYLSQEESNEVYTGVFGLYFGDFESVNASVTLYIPEDAVLKQTDIYNDSGDTDISGVKFQTARIESSYGDLTLREVSGKDMDVNLDDGALTVNDLNTENFSLLSESGDTEISNSVLGNAHFQMTYGELAFDTVKADFLTVTSEDGNVTLKETSCKSTDFTLEYGNLNFEAAALETLTCDMVYGDVTLSLPESITAYQLSANLEYGDLTLPKDAAPVLRDDESDEISYQSEKTDKNAKRVISIYSEDGNVTVDYR